MSLNRILCPTDLSETSILGLQQAVEIAKEHGAELVVMHVSNDFFRADKTSSYYTDTMGSFADEIGQLRRMVHDLQDVRCRTHHCLGNPPHEIVEFAKNEPCDLIVIGSHGRSGFKKMILGSVAEKVINSSETSVLVVKESLYEGTHAFRCKGTEPVVIPFDFSEACQAALEYSQKLGIDPKRLQVVNVAEPVEPYHEGGPSKQKRESEVITANRSRFYEECCPESLRNAEFRTLFDFDVAGRIDNHANEVGASIIIMPTNQKNFLTRFLLGSVANTVARTSPCPTLVVKRTHAEHEHESRGQESQGNEATDEELIDHPEG